MSSFSSGRLKTECNEMTFTDSKMSTPLPKIYLESESEEQQRRRFESTKLKLQMLSRKTQDIKLDDYINNLTLDDECFEMHTSNKVESKVAINTIPKPVVEASGNTCDFKNQDRKWDVLANELSGVFVDKNQSNSSEFLTNQMTGQINDLPQVDYVTNHNAFLSNSITLHKPSWLTNVSNLPKVYQDVLKAATKSYGLDSAVIYDVFRSSRLPTETLYHIWSLTSRTQPGWFTPIELVTALALIGIAQRDQWDINTSGSIADKLKIRTVYEQICPPVPDVQFDFATNSTAVTVRSVNENLFENAFQPPIVAFSTFNTMNNTNVNNVKRNQSSEPVSIPTTTTNDNKTDLYVDALSMNNDNSDSNINMKIAKSCTDQEWSDYSSFIKHNIKFPECAIKQKCHNIDLDFFKATTSATLSPTDLLNKTTAAQLSEFESSLNNLEDEFGEFQTVSTNPTNVMTNIKNVPVEISSISANVQTNYHHWSDQTVCLTDKIDLLRDEWIRCLKQCLISFHSSLDALSLLSTPDEKAEFGRTDEGRDFLLDVLEIYMLVKRINISARKYGVLNPSMQQEFSDIESVFGKLLCYAVLPDMKQKISSAMSMIHSSMISTATTTATTTASSSTSNVNSSPTIYPSNTNCSIDSICGVCLTELDLSLKDQSSPSTDPDIFSTDHNSVCISLAGRNYHAPCANFWTNQIQLSLPALCPPNNNGAGPDA